MSRCWSPRSRGFPLRTSCSSSARSSPTRLANSPIGQWQGPIPSGYGAHLVFVRGRSEGRLPELDEVRDAVRREWANAGPLEVGEKLYQQLLQKYTVSIERPQPAEKREKQAEGY